MLICFTLEFMSTMASGSDKIEIEKKNKIDSIFKLKGLKSKMNVCIFDSETNLELTYGEVGEICFSGPTLMKMYFHNPDETEKILRLLIENCH